MKKKKKLEDEIEEVVEAIVEEVLEGEQTSEQEQALAAEKDRYLRLAAEYENYRKRSQKEREDLQVYIRADVAAKFLPVYDNLERAIQTETEDEAFFKGVEMTMAQLCEVFESLGISKIPAVGETFNPELHNAVFHIEDEQYGESEIVEQFLTGFTIGDKVLRHSVVKVAN